MNAPRTPRLQHLLQQACDIQAEEIRATLSSFLLVFLLTYFPLLLASMAGFSILDNRMLYLTRSMGASQLQTFRYLRLPSALPIIFSGLKTSATIAATAAIVAEFVGANKGLGYLLLEATSTLDTELIFAIILVLTLIGIGLNYLVELVEYFKFELFQYELVEYVDGPRSLKGYQQVDDGRELRMYIPFEKRVYIHGSRRRPPRDDRGGGRRGGRGGRHRRPRR
mgnify:CR=1 FL=1